jgi:hypothetical protein
MFNRITTSCLILAMIAPLAMAGPTYTDPEKTDEDFGIQGEYTGTISTSEGEKKFGVQIIALGDGKFQSVGFHGGLPGDGWNGEDRVRIDGERKDGVVTFEDEHGVGTVKDGKLVVTTADGKQLGAFARVNRKSDTLGKAPPEGAVVLFDGTTADAFKGGKMTEDNLLMQGVTSKQLFGDHKLHLEFILPYKPADRGQARGNSGCYLQGRYEVQILDSFGLDGKNNECGGVYSVAAPDVNMCYPPLTWQTYDIEYTAAKYDDSGKVTAAPRMTVLHNGVKIHDDLELPANRGTTASPVKPGPEKGPLYLQNHGNPVSFRNIWIVETGE